MLAGCAGRPVAFTVAGFDWWEAYRLLVTRYHQGAGGVRPYGYWVWANLACTVVVVGPATVAGLRRAAAASRWCARRAPRSERQAARTRCVVSAALLALLVADLSGMSKAETERIWLPFALWLLPACAFLTGARGGWPDRRCSRCWSTTCCSRGGEDTVWRPGVGDTGLATPRRHD